MTHDQTTPAPVEVTQDDREAAADEILWRGLPRTLANAVRNGQHDDHHTVQAFARHRIAHSAPAGEVEPVAMQRTINRLHRELAGLRAKYVDALAHPPAQDVAALVELVEALRPFANINLAGTALPENFAFDVLHARAALAKHGGA